MTPTRTTTLAAIAVSLLLSGCGVKDPYSERSALPATTTTTTTPQAPDGAADLRRKPEGEVAARYIVAARTLAAGPQRSLTSEQLRVTTGALRAQIVRAGVPAPRPSSARLRQVRIRAVLAEPTTTRRAGPRELLVVCDEYDSDTGNQRTAYRLTVRRTPGGYKVSTVAAALPGDIPTQDGQWQPDPE